MEVLVIRVGQPRRFAPRCRLEPGAGGLGGGIGGRGGDGGDSGAGGDAATVINRGGVTGSAGFSAENKATAGTSSTTVAHGGNDGEGGTGGFETVHLKIAADGAMEGKENFVITLRDVSGSAVIGTSRITGAINDEMAPVPTDGDDDPMGTSHADSIGGKGGYDTLRGGGGDVLNGGAGRDDLKGGGGHDTIDGGKSGDYLSGGATIDTVAFSDGFGHDTASGFSANDHEDIDLSDVSAITGFHDLTTHHLAADNDTGFAMITDGTSNTILLVGFTVDDFGAAKPISGADFIFA